ncbi:MAG: YitT family protein [Anaerolineaceae bacterium]|nr:YitT family protein [Anaerolineaceae bacterium]
MVKKNQHNPIRQFFSQLDFSWKTIRDYIMILVGAFIQALSLRLFLVPSQLVSGGLSGAGQILHYLYRWPIGLVVFIGNIPLFILGWRYLGGPRFATRTILAIVAFSAFTDLLLYQTGQNPVTPDPFLNTLYGGIVMGVGLGIVYRGRGTSGGTDILGRILNRQLGMSISMAYLLTEAVVIFAAGIFFDWEKALYGLLMIFVSGVAADRTLEGSNVVRSVMIITDKLEAISQALMDELERGTTIINAQGGYSKKERPILFCVVTSSELMQLKTIVQDIDPEAFMVVGSSNEALGEGFTPLKEASPVSKPKTRVKPEA